MLLSLFWGGQMLLSYHETGGQMLCMTTFFAVIIFVIIIIEIVIVAGFTGWRRNTCKHVRPSPATPRPPSPTSFCPAVEKEGRAVSTGSGLLAR